VVTGRPACAMRLRHKETAALNHPMTPPPAGINSLRTGPNERGRFGEYGGRFVAETLMPLIRGGRARL